MAVIPFEKYHISESEFLLCLDFFTFTAGCPDANSRVSLILKALRDSGRDIPPQSGIRAARYSFRSLLPVVSGRPEDRKNTASSLAETTAEPYRKASAHFLT